MKKMKMLVVVFLAVFVAACSSDSSSSGADETGGSASCTSLCTDAGFDDGTEEDFGGGLVECTCSGSGDGIEQADCTTYCEEFDVSAEDSLLSTEETANDKCVCDGTTV